MSEKIQRGDRTNSIGTCSICGYHGPGPQHACKLTDKEKMEKLEAENEKIKHERDEYDARRRESIAKYEVLREEHQKAKAENIQMALELGVLAKKAVESGCNCYDSDYEDGPPTTDRMCACCFALLIQPPREQPK